MFNVQGCVSRVPEVEGEGGGQGRGDGSVFSDLSESEVGFSGSGVSSSLS